MNPAVLLGCCIAVLVFTGTPASASPSPTPSPALNRAAALATALQVAGSPLSIGEQGTAASMPSLGLAQARAHEPTTPQQAQPNPTQPAPSGEWRGRLRALLANMYIPAGTKRAADNSPYSRYKRRNPTWYFLAIGGGILLITLALVIFGLVTQELAILIFFVGIVGFLIFCIGIYWLIFRNRRQLLPRI